MTQTGETTPNASTATATIGIIGVGAMGLAITERLISADHTVAGYRRTTMEAFAKAGGIPLPSAAAVVQSCDPLILLLPSDEALAATMDAVAPSLHQGQTILCLGTHRVSAKQAAATIAATAGATLLDGEISGTPGMVRANLASVLLAGDAAAAARAAPVLAAFARAITDCGEFGNAARFKLITNYLVGLHTLAAADALRFARQMGLDLNHVVTALAPSAAGSTMLSVRGRMMAENAYADGSIAGFTTFFDRLREAIPNADSELLNLAETTYQRAIAQGYGNQDIAAVFKIT